MLPDGATLASAGLSSGAALSAHMRLRGGGGDGGSTGAESRSCYLEMYAVSLGPSAGDRLADCIVRPGSRRVDHLPAHHASPPWG